MGIKTNKSYSKHSLNSTHLDVISEQLTMKLVKVVFLLLFVLPEIFSQNHMKVTRRNVLLNRRKRYLNFPPMSNLVITTSITKPLIRPQPLGYGSILEMDVPFPLPSDLWTMKMKMKDMKDMKAKKKFWKVHYTRRYKREILQQFVNALEGVGLNSTSCVQRMYCDVKEYLNTKTPTKSLIKEVLRATFKSVSEENNFSNCEDEIFEMCSLPLFGYIMRSLTTPHEQKNFL